MSYIHEEVLDDDNLGVFAEIKTAFGFVPNFFRAQTMRTDLVEAEACLLNTILEKEGALPRKHKEYIFLVCSAANLSTYCVTAHCEIVRMLKIEGPEPEQIAFDHTATKLPIPIKALLNFVLKLNNQPARVSRGDVEALRTYGYSDQQIMEAVVVVGMAKFTNFIAFGLGTVPDFDSSKVLLRQDRLAASEIK